ncbi:BnaC07g48460D [Brassica napus]|uniref:(rape) hypothetical protein n=1 Tax=Brassica napus TaxID=3708 RepID=A0A078J219_BRANA|nr:unnamed protein product [Brassica napus]CDY59633.1 BnaC07g48460D [Brassica napus]
MVLLLHLFRLREKNQKIRRRQEMCEELSRNAADLTYENENLRRSVKPETNELEKPTKPSQVEMSTSPTPFNFYNQNQYQFSAGLMFPSRFKIHKQLFLQTSTIGEKYFMKTFFQLPAFRFLHPGLGFLPRVWVPSPGSGSLPPASGFQAK